jgi:DNA-binding NtrC family response regulator
MANVMIVDDEETHARALARFLERRGYGTAVAIDAAQAHGALDAARPDVVLLDQRLGTDDGIAMLRAWHARDAHLPVIVMTAYGSVDTAVAAMKAGARDYLQKPVDLEELAVVADRTVAEARTRAYLHHLERAVAPRPLLGSSRAMDDVRAFVDRMRAVGPLAAADHPTVLLLGETGTGKSVVAQALHHASALSEAPFVVVDCATIAPDVVEAELFGFERSALRHGEAAAPGLLEIAAGGTVFLDEVAELPVGAQAKLLRALEEKRVRRLGAVVDVVVDVRIIAATNRDLAREVDAGRFRRDLYYRLSALALTLPPLRDRGDDAVLLATHFMEVYARKYGRPAKRLSPSAVAALVSDSWLGNVRELAHVIERTMLMVDGDTVDAAHLRHAVRPLDQAPTTANLAEVERQVLRRALEDNGGNVSRAARRLGVSRELMRSRMRKHGLV